MGNLLKNGNLLCGVFILDWAIVVNIWWNGCRWVRTVAAVGRALAVDLVDLEQK